MTEAAPEGAKMDYTKVKAVCIGEQTALEAEKYGMQTYIAEKASIDSMVACFLALNGKDSENDI